MEGTAWITIFPSSPPSPVVTSRSLLTLPHRPSIGFKLKRQFSSGDLSLPVILSRNLPHFLSFVKISSGYDTTTNHHLATRKRLQMVHLQPNRRLRNNTRRSA